MRMYNNDCKHILLTWFERSHVQDKLWDVRRGMVDGVRGSDVVHLCFRVNSFTVLYFFSTRILHEPFTLLTSSSPACWTGSICPSERWVWAVRVSAAGGTGRQTASLVLDWWAGRAGSARWTSADSGSLCWTHTHTQCQRKGTNYIPQLAYTFSGK